MSLGDEPASEELSRVLRAFAKGDLLAAEPVPGGHIHASYLVRLAGGGPPLFLQRINTAVYPDPRRLMENVQRICRHLSELRPPEAHGDARRRGLELLTTRGGEACFTDPETGASWRLFLAIEGTRVDERADTADQARAAAAAFGQFFADLNRDGPLPLHEVIPRFHDTPQRYAALDAALAADPVGRAAGVGSEVAFLRTRRAGAGVLVDLVAAGVLPTRAVHNDPKPTNLLLDASSGEPLCVVDLDNAMLGSSLHDFGDMARAMSSPTDEDELRLDAVALRPELFEALVDGWLAAAGPLLVRAELDHLVDASWVITLEQGVRFLTDHVLGDVTYRTARADHNLDRCRTQLRLVTSLEHQRDELEASVEALRQRHRLPRADGGGSEPGHTA